MILYSSQVSISIIIVSAFVLTSIYLHFNRKNYQIALLMLIISGLILRLLMASVDPFLQEWDERFHALVAKNLMNHPFQPMLRVNPIMPYRIEDWCCNHIWLHKQPLFLYQMALSMKIFGINEISIRIPSAIMGSISIYFIYDIAKKWIKNIDVAYLAALLFAVSYYQLELTSGRLLLDQNDVAFTFYVTASFWAFIKYLYTESKLKWALTIGLFVGCAVLIKWLTGILVFGGWGFYILLESRIKFEWKEWRYLFSSVIVSLFVFIPWQLYISHEFPIETSIMHKSNINHMLDDLGHPGSMWFHLNHMRTIYGQYLLLFAPFGIYQLFKTKNINKNLSISFISMIIVIYFFFSVIVKTKMPAFTFPVNSIVWILISFGILTSLKYRSKNKIFNSAFAISILLSFYTLKPWKIIAHRSKSNVERNSKIENTLIYKNLNLEDKLKGRIILNCKGFEDVELMFYKDVNAFHWYPKENTLDSLMQRGFKFAAFKSHNNQGLAKYIYTNKDIIIIDKQLR